MTGRNGLHSIGLLAAAMAAAAPGDVSRAVLIASAPTPEIPKSALGDGSRARHRDKPFGPSAAAKKRRRKLARQSQRRNRGRA